MKYEFVCRIFSSCYT